MAKSMTVRTWYINGFYVVDGAEPVGTTPRGRSLFGDHQVKPRSSNDPLLIDLPNEATPVEWRKLGYRQINGTTSHFIHSSGLELLRRDQVEPLTAPRATPPADPRDVRLWRKGQSEAIKSPDPLSEEFQLIGVDEAHGERRLIEIIKTHDQRRREKLLRHVENALPTLPAGPAWTMRETPPPDAFGRSAWHNPIWGT